MRNMPFPQQILTQAKPAVRTNSSKPPGGVQSIKNDKRNTRIETTSEILETLVLLRARMDTVLHVSVCRIDQLR